MNLMKEYHFVWPDRAVIRSVLFKEYYGTWQMPDWVAAAIGFFCAFSVWHIAALFAILSPPEGRMMIWGFAAYAAMMTLYGLISKRRLALGQIDALTLKQRLSTIMGVALLVGMVMMTLAVHFFPSTMQQVLLWSLHGTP